MPHNFRRTTVAAWLLAALAGALAEPAAAKIVALYSFKSIAANDGARPSGYLVADDNGVLGIPGAIYGTTEFGGKLCDNGTNTCGTVFQLTPPAAGQTRWRERVLYVFQGGSDGKNPKAGLILDPVAKVLYGTTPAGGSGYSSCFGGGGCGMVFRLEPPLPGETTWRYAPLYVFANQDGEKPSGLVLRNGAPFGTTQLGGKKFSRGGTVFRLDPPSPGGTPWIKTVIHDLSLFRLKLQPRGERPFGGVTFDAADAIYFTTKFGGGDGTTECPQGCGTIYKLTPPASGGTEWTARVLYRFQSGTYRGYLPITGLTLLDHGIVIGITSKGGRNGTGTLFGLGPRNPAASGSTTAPELMDYLDVHPWPLGALIDPEFPPGSRQAGELAQISALAQKAQRDSMGAFLEITLGPYISVKDLKETIKVEHPEWFPRGGRSGAMPSGPAIPDNTTGALLVPAEGGGAGDFGTISKVEPGL